MTIQDIQNLTEGQTFDCKSIRIEPKAYKYVKEFGEGIDRICLDLEKRGSAIPTFHLDAFILKSTLRAEWTNEKELERFGVVDKTVQVPSKYRPSTVQVPSKLRLWFA